MPPDKEQRKRLKSWLDFAEKHGNHPPHVLKGIWEPSVSVFEGYRSGSVEAHYHIGIRSDLLAVNPSYFCARLKAGDELSSSPEDAAWLHSADCEIVEGSYLRGKTAKVVCGNRLNLSVLVPNYEGVEQREGMAVPSCAPLVRLVALDACPVLRKDARHSLPHLLPEHPAVKTDSELRLGAAFPLRFAPRPDEVVGQVVEGGAEVGKNVASDKAPLDGQFLDAHDMPGKEITLAVELFPERVRWFGVEVQPSPDVMLEFVEVFLSPVELVPASFVEGTHGV